MHGTRIVRLGMALAAGLLTVGGAGAQGPGGPPPGPFGGPPGPFGGPPGMRGGGAMLVMIPEVQAELKLTDDQKSKLAGLRQEMQQQMQRTFQQVREKAQDATPEERQ